MNERAAPHPLPSGWHDLSPAIAPATAVFPGDTAFSAAVVMAFEQGEHLRLTTWTTTPHVGAHADGPCHYVAGGQGIGERPVQRYIGDAQVVSVRTRQGERIVPTDLARPVQAPRVLLRTDSFADPNQWRDDFCSLSVELVDHLAAVGVVLVGLDTPSVDPGPAKELLAHAAVARNDLAILEGLDLRGVPDGLYTLLAQPLPVVGGDASPVRALLVPRQPGLETLPLTGNRSTGGGNRG